MTSPDTTAETVATQVLLVGWDPAAGTFEEDVALYGRYTDDLGVAVRALHIVLETAWSGSHSGAFVHDFREVWEEAEDVP